MVLTLIFYFIYCVYGNRGFVGNEVLMYDTGMLKSDVPCTAYGGVCLKCNTKDGCLSINPSVAHFCYNSTTNNKKYCYSCSEIYGNKCTSCTFDGCQKCSSGYRLVDGFCSPECLRFGSKCQRCSTDKCTSCASGAFQINNFGCYSCKEAFGNYCNSCNSTGCIKCNQGAYLASTKECIECSKKFAHCSRCSSTACSACSSGYYLSGGKCVSCISGCSQCSSRSVCNTCKSGYYKDSNNKCQTCSSKYESNCAKCNSSYCLSCSSGFINYDTHSCSQTCYEKSKIGYCNLCITGNCLLCSQNHFISMRYSNDKWSSSCAFESFSHCSRVSEANVSRCIQCEEGYVMESTSGLFCKSLFLSR